MVAKDELAARRLRTALDLADIAEEMLELRLRRQQPDLSDTEIRARIAEWYERRPGAAHGDAEGIPGHWPRSH